MSSNGGRKPSYSPLDKPSVPPPNTVQQTTLVIVIAVLLIVIGAFVAAVCSAVFSQKGSSHITAASYTIQEAKNLKLEEKEQCCHPRARKVCRKSSDFADYDYIVVGAGAGGSVVAARLAQEMCYKKVLLIDAGDDLNTLFSATYSGLSIVKTPFLFPWAEGFEFVPGFTAWNFTTTPQVNAGNDVWQYPRGKGLGGSTNHHAMAHVRIGKIDADTWAKHVGDDRWNFDHVLPFIKKMENDSTAGKDPFYHNTNGWLHLRHPVREAAQDAFINAGVGAGLSHLNDFNGDPNNVAGVGNFDAQINHMGQRSFAAQDLLWPVYQASQATGGCKNLDIWTQTLALELVFDENHPTRVVGIKYLKNTTQNAYSADESYDKTTVKAALNDPNSVGVVKARQEVILAGGAFNTPQLMMLSGLGPKEHLAELEIPVVYDLPGVGNNLLDHIEYATVHQLSSQYSYIANIGATVGQYLTNGGGIFGSNGVGVVADWFSDVVPRNHLAPECHIQNCVFYFEGFNFSDWHDTPTPGVSYMTNLIEISHPNAKQGTIRLRSRDPTETPFIDERLAASELDLEMMAGCINLTRQIMSRPEMSSHSPVEVRPGLSADTTEELIEVARGSAFGHHASGTTKMGPRCDRQSVVDADLRVYGVSGLRVGDASMFPTIVRGNPSSAVYLVGEVLADMIIKSQQEVSDCTTD